MTETDLLKRIDQLLEQNAQLMEKIDQLEAQLNKKKGKKPTRKDLPNGEGACRAITVEEYDEIMEAFNTGFTGMRPNPVCAAVLTIEANTGLRISDIVKLRLADVVPDGGRRRLNITEKKTGKARRFTVNDRVYQYMLNYCYQNGIKQDEVMLPITPRSVQRQLAKVVDYLGLEGTVSTHSFRKLFATRIYSQTGNNLVLCQELLQHSSPETTRRYIGVSSAEVEEALENGTIL